MKIEIETKRDIGEAVNYFQNDIVQKYGGVQEVKTTEVKSEIDEILIRVTKSEIEVKYKMKDGAVRDDNTIHS